MADNLTTQRLLLARFSDFYEEVARIKLAIRDGSLAAYLAGGRNGERAGGVAASGPSPVAPPVPSRDATEAAADDATATDDETAAEAVAPAINGIDLAAGVSQRLLGRLREQGRQVRECAGEQEKRLYRFAQYAMAAHADELFALELEWPGREHWDSVLLERALFRTATSGRDFFVYCDRILAARGHNRLMEDLAAVYLTAIQLGFKGRYRGHAQLADYRKRLLRFIGCGQPGERDEQAQGAERAFAQAYLQPVSEARPARLRPLSRWYRWAAVGGVLYLVLSSALWIASTGRFLSQFGNG